MSVNRRQLIQMGALGSAITCYPRLAGAVGVEEPVVADNGLYAQPWFLKSFMELSDDIASAAEEDKLLAVLFEQRGCPYCRELHRINFAKKEIRDYIEKHFHVMQLDLWGSREVTDFDGTVLTEKALAQRWAVSFTPTFIFFPHDPKAAQGKIGKDAEIARMPGYFKPFHFLSMLQYVQEGKYGKQHFQRFLQDKFKKLEAEGKTPEVW